MGVVLVLHIDRKKKWKDFLNPRPLDSRKVEFLFFTKFGIKKGRGLLLGMCYYTFCCRKWLYAAGVTIKKNVIITRVEIRFGLISPGSKINIIRSEHRYHLIRAVEPELEPVKKPPAPNIT